MRKVSLACAALFAAVFVSPSLAGDIHYIPRMTVSFADLDMSRADGAATALNRLKSAARTVCGYRPAVFQSLREQALYRKCYDAAMDQAVVHVDNAIVAQLYGKPSLVAAEPTGETIAVSDSARLAMSNH